MVNDVVALTHDSHDDLRARVEALLTDRPFALTIKKPDGSVEHIEGCRLRWVASGEIRPFGVDGWEITYDLPGDDLAGRPRAVTWHVPFGDAAPVTFTFAGSTLTITDHATENSAFVSVTVDWTRTSGTSQSSSKGSTSPDSSE